MPNQYWVLKWFVAPIFLLLFLFLGLPNFLMIHNVRNLIHSHEERLSKKSTAIVLGAGVRGVVMSQALHRRMAQAVMLYRNGWVSRILITGDGSSTYYKETQAMKSYAIKEGVPEEHITEDPHGYSTLVSIYRASFDYRIKSAYVVSQSFHLPRALWLANYYGIQAEGIPTGQVNKEYYYQLREVGARAKDWMIVYLNLNIREQREGIWGIDFSRIIED